MAKRDKITAVQKRAIDKVAKGKAEIMVMGSSGGLVRINPREMTRAIIDATGGIDEISRSIWYMAQYAENEMVRFNAAKFLMSVVERNMEERRNPDFRQVSNEDLRRVMEARLRPLLQLSGKAGAMETIIKMIEQKANDDAGEILEVEAGEADAPPGDGADAPEGAGAGDGGGRGQGTGEPPQAD